MQRLPTHIVQSFWLRFWSEPGQAEPQHWRGTIWHEQQPPGEKPIPVACPEAAFEIVRRALGVSAAADKSKDLSAAHARADAHRNWLSKWLHWGIIRLSLHSPASIRRREKT
jgi:hypothetical protein